jgi:hypothetical protein
MSASPCEGSTRATRPVLVALVVVLSVAAGFPAFAAADGTINSWFGADADGWTIAGDAASPDYVETGGNPGGHICADDDVAGNTWYFAAPGKFLGDQSGAYGGALQFDSKQSTTSDQFSNHDVVLRNASATLVYDFGNASDHPRTNWTHYSVPLDASASGWTWASGEPVTATAFETLLANLTQLRIRGEYVSGSDRGCLDTVQLPGSAGENGTSSENTDQPAASIAFANQSVSAEVDTQAVTLASVELDDGGYAVIYDAGGGNGTGPDTVIGATSYLSRGAHENVRITLDGTIPDARRLTARAHRDTDGDSMYEYGDEAGLDGPYTHAGEPVSETAMIELLVETPVPTEPTPAPTATPRPTPSPTPTATATPTPSPTPDPRTPTQTPSPTRTATPGADGPGMGVVVALLAVGLAALPGIRPGRRRE